MGNSPITLPDDKESVLIGGFVGDQLGGESEDVAVQRTSVLEHEFNEVSLRRLRNQLETVAQRVFFPTEAVVRGDF